MLFNTYEKNVIWPMLHYWGFFTNYLELPSIGSVVYSFRVNRKEFNFILTFLVFFLKCFFLNQKVYFRINYNNLMFDIIIKKKNHDFLFYFILFNFIFKFMFQLLSLKKKINSVGNKNKSTIVLSTSKFFLCISEIFNIGFLYFPNNELMWHTYNLFQNVFYSSRSLSFNLNILVNFNINKKFNYINKKVSSFYCPIK